MPMSICLHVFVALWRPENCIGSYELELDRYGCEHHMGPGNLAPLLEQLMPLTTEPYPTPPLRII